MILAISATAKHFLPSPVGELIGHCRQIVIKSGFVVTANPPGS